MDGSRPWSDLPRDIVGLIINKLRFPDHQIRALAVCKSWRDCKDYVRFSLNTLPWVMHHEREYYINSNSSLICKLLNNPYSQEVRVVPNSINMNPLLNITALASKQGWVLFYGGRNSKILLLYNPFTNDTHWIPQQACTGMKATINVDPKSSECEVFMLASGRCLRIHAYKTSGQTTELIDEISIIAGFDSVLYMKGIIYCLSDRGELYSYKLEDKSWNLLDSRHPVPRAAPYWAWVARNEVRKCWLLEINENLIMVFAELEEKVCKLITIFRFDWAEMSWVVETGLKSWAIYISRRLAFSTSLKNRSGEKLEGCRVFYLDKNIKCYVMGEAGFAEIQCEEYSWIDASGIMSGAL